ncbi:MAG: glycosyltransferase family 4 protein [Elusimicrobia bacterium]|nr:glycosyltransferase family 4 protein [Elusimicrobiota bacterium]
MSRKIKIVHVVTLLELGGAQQTALTLLRNLPSDRFDPMLFCGREGFGLKRRYRAKFRVRFVPGLVRQIRPWWDLLALACLYRFLSKERPDIVHTHSSKAGVLGRIASVLAGVPVVVHTVHGFGFTPAQYSWVRWIFVFLERFLARRTAALVFVSKANRTEALARGIGSPSQMHLIRAAVELKDYFFLTRSRETPPGLPLQPTDRVVTTIGPFKPQKNLLDFIRAASLVSPRHPDVRFLVVGDGPGRFILESEIQRRGLARRFVLAGWRKDIPALLARSDVFCMTSLWEGLPMALVEAMAAGLPAVVNAVDGCTDVIVSGKNGFLTFPGDFRGTADRLMELLEDPPLAQQMGRCARESVGKEFDAPTMQRDHERLYLSLSAAHDL